MKKNQIDLKRLKNGAVAQLFAITNFHLLYLHITYIDVAVNVNIQDNAIKVVCIGYRIILSMHCNSF